MRGVQKLLRERAEPEALPISETRVATPPTGPEPDEQHGGVDVFRLIALRDRLTAALEG